MIFNYKNIEVYYEDHGKGDAIVLLHGFLENASMWKHLASNLEPTNRVICIDLLGHGKTDNLGYIHTMEEMSNAVYSVLNHLEIDNYVVVGHSMGGYVALAMAKQNPKAIRGLCLMNSTYRADNQNRKSLRQKAIEMVRKNYELVVRTSVMNLFAIDSRTLFSDEIEEVVREALLTSVQGYVAAQRGMMQREDHFNVLKNLKSEKLIIVGEKDPIIDYKRIKEEIKDTSIPYAQLSLGHMSHIENKSENTDKIMHFIEKIYS